MYVCRPEASSIVPNRLALHQLRDQRSARIMARQLKWLAPEVYATCEQATKGVGHGAGVFQDDSADLVRRFVEVTGLGLECEAIVLSIVRWLFNLEQLDGTWTKQGVRIKVYSSHCFSAVYSDHQTTAFTAVQLLSAMRESYTAQQRLKEFSLSMYMGAVRR